MRSGSLVFVCTAALLAAGGGRLAVLVETQGHALRQRAQQQQTGRVPIPAQRGDILDCKGRVLAGSVRRPSIYVDPTLVENAQKAAGRVAPVLGLSADELERAIRERAKREFLWVKRLLSDAELDAFHALCREPGLEAFGVVDEPVRRYPCGRLAGHVLGFVGAEQHGLAGIEQAYDRHLAGADGFRTVTVDARRRSICSQSDGYLAPADGASVILTLDAHLQQRAEQRLRDAVEDFRADWGTAIVMEPHSGEVLAMAVMPDIDPAQPIPPGLNQREQALAFDRLRNRAISDACEPGSIFKPFIAASALDAGLVHLDQVFAINGPTRAFGARVIHDVHPYGTLAFSEVISKSSNIGMGMLGARLGNARLHEFVRRFGFGDPTGIGLPGEHAGMVLDFSRWTSFSTQSVPIGQELAVTPLQVVTAFCVFCNDGLLCRPRIVRGVIGPDGRVVQDRSRAIAVRRVLDPHVTREFRLRALVEVVRAGTGKAAAIAEYQVFGKTGTAQIARPGNRGYEPGAYVSSFVCGGPASDPKAAVLVTLYHPRGAKYYGGTVAAPAAAEILADALEYMRVPPERTAEIDGPVVGLAW